MMVEQQRHRDPKRTHEWRTLFNHPSVEVNSNLTIQLLEFKVATCVNCHKPMAACSHRRKTKLCRICTVWVASCINGFITESRNIHNYMKFGKVKA